MDSNQIDKNKLIELVTKEVSEKLKSTKNNHPHGLFCTCRDCLKITKESPLNKTTEIPLTQSLNLARMIDHTLLKPEATRDEIKKLCDEARQYNFYSVCVNSEHVGYAAKLVTGSSTKAIAVVGFPLGAGTSNAKAFETKESIKAGAAEIDMVINIGALKEKNYKKAFLDIVSVVEASNGAPVKVILETGLLTDEEKIIGCTLAKVAGASFVKTSTGFSKGGATVEDISLMRRIVGPDMGVKASGGVRDQETALKLIHAGASRLGASASVAIVTGKDTKKTGY